MDLAASNGTDIFLSRSTDGGASWSAALRVNDDATGVANDQFNQWLAVDPTNGLVSMSWQDTRNDPAHQSTDVYYARSTDGGQSVSANVRVTTAMTRDVLRREPGRSVQRLRRHRRVWRRGVSVLDGPPRRRLDG